MKQDKDTGAFHFSGDEDEVAMRWLWSCLLDTSFWGKVELTWRIWFKKPPAFVNYKNPEVYQKRCYEILQGLEKKIARLACGVERQRKGFDVASIPDDYGKRLKEGILKKDENKA